MLLDHLERVADSERRFIYTEASSLRAVLLRHVNCSRSCFWLGEPAVSATAGMFARKLSKLGCSACCSAMIPMRLLPPLLP